MDDDTLLLRFKRDEIRAEYKNNGQKKTKFINMSDLAHMIAKDAKHDTGMLHLAGENYHGVRRYIRKGSVEIIVLEASAAKRKVKFAYWPADDEEFDEDQDQDEQIILEPELVIPTTGMILVTLEEKYRDSYIFTSKFPLVNGSIHLYSWPFGNTYPEGRVCWGGNEIHNLKGQEKFKVLDTFMDSPFNGDLGFLNGGYSARNVRGFAEHLSGQTAFDSGLLSPMNRNRRHITLDELIEEVEQIYVSATN